MVLRLKTRESRSLPGLPNATQAKSMKSIYASGLNCQAIYASTLNRFSGLCVTKSSRHTLKYGQAVLQ